MAILTPHILDGFVFTYVWQTSPKFQMPKKPLDMIQYFTEL